LVRHPPARGLTLRPQFEILGAVVVADAVLVVDFLGVAKRPTEHLLHNKTML
jgi:hypothetical protein